MTCGIYKITNKINGKIYIGQSVNIEGRWKGHINDNRPKTHLKSALAKYGVDNFIFSIICEVPESALDVYEISYIKYYDATNPKKGYNKLSGGANGRPSEETRKKMSITRLGRPGKPHTKETKEKLSNINKGKLQSNETKTKKSISCKGKHTNKYLYEGKIYSGKQELADFLNISYSNISHRILRNQINVTLIGKDA